MWPYGADTAPKTFFYGTYLGGTGVTPGSERQIPQWQDPSDVWNRVWTTGLEAHIGLGHALPETCLDPGDYAALRLTSAHERLTQHWAACYLSRGGDLTMRSAKKGGGKKGGC